MDGFLQKIFIIFFLLLLSPSLISVNNFLSSTPLSPPLHPLHHLLAPLSPIHKTSTQLILRRPNHPSLHPPKLPIQESKAAQHNLGNPNILSTKPKLGISPRRRLKDTSKLSSMVQLSKLEGIGPLSSFTERAMSVIDGNEESSHGIMTGVSRLAKTLPVKLLLQISIQVRLGGNPNPTNTSPMSRLFMRLNNVKFVNLKNPTGINLDSSLSISLSDAISAKLSGIDPSNLLLKRNIDSILANLSSSFDNGPDTPDVDMSRYWRFTRRWRGGGHGEYMREERERERGEESRRGMREERREWRGWGGLHWEEGEESGVG